MLRLTRQHTITSNSITSPYHTHESLGSILRRSLRDGVTIGQGTVSCFDDSSDLKIDPQSDIRNDRWLQAELAQDNALAKQTYSAPTDPTQVETASAPQQVASAE